MPYTAYAYAKTKRRPHNRYRKIRRSTGGFRYKRRRIFRRRRYGARTTYTGIPYQTVIRFKLRSELIEVEPASATAAYTFNVSEIYDPLGVHGTSQPYLYDHYASLYNVYRVLSGVWYVNFVNETGNPVRIAYSLSEDSNAGTSYRILSEQKNGRSCILTAASGSRNQKTIKMPWNSSRYFKGYSIEDQQADFGTNPTNRLFLHLYIESIKYDGTPANLQGVINITAYFRTLLSDYKRQAISVV